MGNLRKRSCYFMCSFVALVDLFLSAPCSSSVISVGPKCCLKLLAEFGFQDTQLSVHLFKNLLGGEIKNIPNALFQGQTF